MRLNGPDRISEDDAQAVLWRVDGLLQYGSLHLLRFYHLQRIPASYSYLHHHPGLLVRFPFILLFSQSFLTVFNANLFRDKIKNSCHI